MYRSMIVNQKMRSSTSNLVLLLKNKCARVDSYYEFESTHSHFCCEKLGKIEIIEIRKIPVSKRSK